MFVIKDTLKRAKGWKKWVIPYPFRCRIIRSLIYGYIVITSRPLPFIALTVPA